MEHSRTVTTLLVSLVCVGLTHAADAQPERFTFQSPTGCGSREQIDAGVERITSKGLEALISEGFRVDLRLMQVGEHWPVRVSFTLPDGKQHQRQLTANSCEAALNAAIVVLATSLAKGHEFEPGVEATAVATPPEAEPTPALPTASTAPPPRPVRAVTRSRAEPKPRAERARAPLHLFAAASFGADVGWIPAPLAQLNLAAGIRRRDTSLAGFFAVTNSATLELAGPTETAQVSLLLAGAELCTRLLGRQPALKGCASGELGRFHARGDQVVGAKAQNSLWAAGGLAVGVDWQLLPRLAIQAAATGVLAFKTYDIIAEPGFGYRTAQVALRAKLGLRWDIL